MSDKKTMLPPARAPRRQVLKPPANFWEKLDAEMSSQLMRRNIRPENSFTAEEFKEHYCLPSQQTARHRLNQLIEQKIVEVVALLEHGTKCYRLIN